MTFYRGEDHICNRYCGGSHTVTTPQQRVTRLGHFVQQWGPGVLPMGEGVIRGTDGQVYLVSPSIVKYIISEFEFITLYFRCIRVVMKNSHQNQDHR